MATIWPEKNSGQNNKNNNKYMINVITLFVFGYLLGSIPFGYIIGKYKKIDIRKHGSGNIGGTNIGRTLGFKYAFLVGVLDITKAVIPIYLGNHYLTIDWQRALVALSPVLGHVFPVWLKFKGGKAISTIYASILVISGLKFSLIFLGTWFIMLNLIKIMSLTNLIIILSVPVIFWYKTHSWVYVVLAIIYIVIAYYAHRENIDRLRKGTEPKIIK